MREMTFTELDQAVAEQLPSRELMGGYWYPSRNTAVAGNSSSGFINVLNGNQVQVLTFGSSNGNTAWAG